MLQFQRRPTSRGPRAVISTSQELAFRISCQTTLIPVRSPTCTSPSSAGRPVEKTLIPHWVQHLTQEILTVPSAVYRLRHGQKRPLADFAVTAGGNFLFGLDDPSISFAQLCLPSDRADCALKRGPPCDSGAAKSYFVKTKRWPGSLGDPRARRQQLLSCLHNLVPK